MSIERAVDELFGSRPRFSAREFREFHERSFQLMRRILNPLAKIALRIRQIFLAQKNFREAKNGSEGRAQFMREMGHRSRTPFGEVEQLGVLRLQAGNLVLG